MPFTDTSKFWVIFDTCTVRDYYLDVHKLLALPTGGTLRYEYREKYLSPSGISASSNTVAAPRFGLLLYAQKSGFVKGSETPRTGTLFEDMLWIPTRIVEMLNIPPREGESFFYDFKVLRYPFLDQPELHRILAPLIAVKEVPFNKWVTTSAELPAFQKLDRGDERTNWPSLVSEFHKPQCQFSFDAFWRIVGPKKSKSGRIISPDYQKIVQTDGNKEQVRQIRAIYEIAEGTPHSFELISITSPRPVTNGPKQYSVRCSSPNKKNLQVIGSGLFELRQYTAQPIEFVAKTSAELVDRSTTVLFETEPKSPDWPAAPELELVMVIAKGRLRTVIGFIFLLIGTVIGGYGTTLWQSAPRSAAAWVVGALCSFAIGGLLLNRKLSLKI